MAPPERAFPHAYFGAAPDPLQRARLTLAQQVARCFAVTIFLLLAVQRGQGRLPTAPERAALPSFPEALRGLGAGTFSIGQPAGMLTFSLVVANHALAELDQPAFAQALALGGGEGVRGEPVRAESPHHLLSGGYGVAPVQLPRPEHRSKPARQAAPLLPEVISRKVMLLP